MFTSYHVHSTHSDGESSISEIIEAAIGFNLDEIGISDHYALLPGGSSIFWSMPLNGIDNYLNEINSCASKIGGSIKVRKGLEVDYFPETENAIKDLLAKFPLDYTIGSVHFVDEFPIDENKSNWEELTRARCNDIVIAYWDRITKMANSRLFDIAGHLDLYKKFGHYSDVDVSDQINTALDAIAESGMAVEFSTAGWFKDAKEAYPSDFILKQVKEKNIPIIITSDAHLASHLMRSYEDAYSKVKELGFSSTVIYDKRKQIPIIL